MLQKLAKVCKDLQAFGISILWQPITLAECMELDIRMYIGL